MIKRKDMRTGTAFLTLLLIISCARNGSVMTKNTIVADIEKAIPLSLDVDDGLRLSDVQLGMIDDAWVKDTLLMLFGNNALHAFSTQTGKLSMTFSRQGRGPLEYIRIWDYGADDDGIYIYDIDGKQMLFFLWDGSFKKMEKLTGRSADNPFQAIIRAPWGKGYVGKRIYGTPEVPELSSYDEHFRYVSPIGAYTLRSGLKLWRQLYLGSDGDVLYNRYFSNEVLSLTSDSLAVKYIVHFPHRNVPEMDDEYDALELLGKKNTPYAVIMSQIKETDKYFGFQFAAESNRYYAVYDKLSGNCKVYLPIVAKQEVQTVFLNDNILFTIASDESGSYVYQVKLVT
ncbi:MAG: 6-bladed beta-propeller [Bacteroidales bacterium]|nr:6-bladed beta-propeller [Bacteroidales bacterium]